MSCAWERDRSEDLPLINADRPNLEPAVSCLGLEGVRSRPGGGGKLIGAAEPGFKGLLIARKFCRFLSCIAKGEITVIALMGLAKSPVDEGGVGTAVWR